MASACEQRNYADWCWAENNLLENSPTYLINLKYGVCIHFDYPVDEGVEFEEFLEEKTKIQFISNHKFDQGEINALLAEAWNYFCLEEEELNKFCEEENP